MAPLFEKVKFPIRTFQVKLTLIFILSMLATLVLSDLLVYQYMLHAQVQALRQRLMVIAQTAAFFIDAEEIKRIPLDRSGTETGEYRHVVAQLHGVKSINSQISYIYTLAPTKQEGIWQFVADPDPQVSVGRAVMTSYPGDRYEAGRFPQMMAALKGPSADFSLQIDEWGVTLSGYAPIRDTAGRPVAVLGVDMAADDVYQTQQEIPRRMAWVVLIGVVLAFFLGMVGSRKISRPLKDLVRGTKRIADGDLTYQVEIKGETEFHELAHSFNQMAVSLDESRRRIVGYFYGVVRSLIKVLEFRDQYTRGHSESVAILAGKIATKLGYSQDVVKLFKRMTLLHDIGKIGIKDTILNKPGPLTDEEWEVIRRHPAMGEEILKPVLSDEEMLAVVRGHHERYDGTGYPDQVKGDAINTFAAIVSVADAYDAMTSDRSYRKALSREEAVQELMRCRGTQFHPKIVDTFLQILEEEKSGVKKSRDKEKHG